MHSFRSTLAASSLALAACSGAEHGAGGAGGSTATSGQPTSAVTTTGGPTASNGSTSATGGSGPCTTRISYGDAWIHPPNHPDSFDDVTGTVTWDGSCAADGPNSMATLSNGFQPIFAGHGACVIALDTTCPGAPACTTRIRYGASWIPAPNHPDSFDDVPGRVYWNRHCTNASGESSATLSNTWAPHFTGADACDLSFAYSDCGGLYQNPVVPVGCADPGVLADGNQYVAVCTSGNAPDAFPIRTSTDLVHWTLVGSILPSAAKPAWAMSDFWAPEIHRVGSQYVAYFSARHQNGRLSIGAATSANATGPFVALAQPLVQLPSLGAIDATEMDDSVGNHYLLWKVDGNAVGQATPIFGQMLSPDGTSLVGSKAQLITNDEGWEGGVVEGPWVTIHGGLYYLFYSGNAYYNGTYAVGVARSANPLGPYQKLGAPILTTSTDWVGPGHCSVVDSPLGESVMVYHAWQAGHVNGPGDERLMLVDPIDWSGDWPTMVESPSSHARSGP